MQLALSSGLGFGIMQAPSDVRSINNSTRQPLQPLEEPRCSMETWLRMTAILSFNLRETVSNEEDTNVLFRKFRMLSKTNVICVIQFVFVENPISKRG